ncbi:FUN14 domain-containing protein 1 isoform X2 [Periplaneta americana]|uniref:FUN14 domain-containing protein 1 isoform X2 n=1 Tax=Periplaneta americana TaxID=6978 RepID=UPI0037E7E534
MASPAVRKSNKEEEENELISIDEVAKETKGFIDRVLGDVGKSSATKQLVIGSISGWCTGFITMKVGKVAAIAVGGGIILLQVANHQGYINVNWDKVYKKIDKVADKVEEKATGQGPKWMEKVGDFARKNTYAAAGFVGGFFLGLASS